MSQIQAIETEYKGYLFRSRLEARWAVFFDTLGIEWKYENEGYKTAEGEMYLPDFVLPGYGGRHWTRNGTELGDIFVEVKGDPHGLVKDFQRQVSLHDWGGVLPNFTDSYNAHPVNGLLLGYYLISRTRTTRIQLMGCYYWGKSQKLRRLRCTFILLFSTTKG